MRKLLIATCFSLGIAFIWRVVFGAEHLNYKDFVYGIPLIASAIGVATERSEAKPFRLTPSFDSGLFGGLIGGAFAGLLIGVAYFVQFSGSDKSLDLLIVPEIFAYGSLSGLLLGASTLLVILRFRYLVIERQYPQLVFNDVTGGVIGGAIGGFPSGALAGLLFGFLHENVVEPIVLVAGSVLGAIFVGTGALFYDYRGLWQNVMRAFIASLLIAACTATVGIMILQHVDISAWFHSGTTRTLMTEEGAILGAVVGMVSGGQIGLTLALYRLWEATAES